MSGIINLSADVVVIGSGPGGATVCRELTRSGRRVLLLERGIDHRRKFYYGTYLGALRYSDRGALLFTDEGLNIIAPIMLGGATSMYCACAAEPPPWFERKYGIDLAPDAELDIRPLPAHLRGTASTHIAAVGRSLGYDWFPQPKFMQPRRCDPGKGGFRCQADCMLGCRCGAKWNAAEWVDEAVAGGAGLMMGARVERILVEGRQATGVSGTVAGRSFVARGEAIVVSAGGIGSPRILQASGLEAAGIGMTMDTTTMVYGFTRRKGTGLEPPMTWSWENPAGGYMLSTLTDPWLLYPTAAVRKSLRAALGWFRWHRMLGIMIKLKDDISGGIYPDGRIRKPMTADDDTRLKEAYAICRRILIAAGAEASDIFMRPFIGTHPSGTVRIGEMLDTDLKTEIDGLYVCDASVFPEALDRPTVLTIIGLAKRLARHLSASARGENP